jgi:hypothetical protein
LIKASLDKKGNSNQWVNLSKLHKHKKQSIQ